MVIILGYPKNIFHNNKQLDASICFHIYITILTRSCRHLEVVTAVTCPTIKILPLIIRSKTKKRIPLLPLDILLHFYNIKNVFIITEKNFYTFIILQVCALINKFSRLLQSIIGYYSLQFELISHYNGHLFSIFLLKVYPS